MRILIYVICIAIGMVLAVVLGFFAPLWLSLPVSIALGVASVTVADTIAPRRRY